MRSIVCRALEVDLYTIMASFFARIGLMVFGLVMMAVGGIIALLMIVWTMITHPFTVFKKVPRNGELLYSVTPYRR